MWVGVGEHQCRLHSEGSFWKFQDAMILRMPDVNTEGLQSSASSEYRLSSWNITLLFNCLSYFPSNFRASCFPTHSTFVEKFFC
ncbi:rCG37956 [Rattus norvegicus]|uniref:RCG37956 n=1 Tax=Rattus norvegicus TaxID=10116 RepID=A6K5W4_RAT|nr:rCG37956 [Rattus norvegicus]